MKKSKRAWENKVKDIGAVAISKAKQVLLRSWRDATERYEEDFKLEMLEIQQT